LYLLERIIRIVSFFSDQDFRFWRPELKRLRLSVQMLTDSLSSLDHPHRSPSAFWWNYRTSIRETFDELQSRSMDISQHSKFIEVPVAPFYDLFSS
jgi:hypothetical protein